MTDKNNNVISLITNRIRNARIDYPVFFYFTYYKTIPLGYLLSGDASQWLHCRSPPYFQRTERYTLKKLKGAIKVFDNKSDYAINKKNKKAIVCKSATETYIELRLEDFASPEEFEKWKDWSDKEYHEEEKNNRAYTRHNLPFNEQLNHITQSAEETLLRDLQAAENANLVAQIKKCLTSTQFRRLVKYYVDGMTEQEIADREGISHQNVSKTLKKAKQKIKMLMPAETKEKQGAK